MNTITESSAHETLIKAPKGWIGIDYKELWEYRELAYFFAWREIKVRYKQTLIGSTWAVFQPLLTTIIFTLFFGKYAKIPSDGIPYSLFVYTGLLFWNYFSFGLSHASDSMISNANVIQKIYFPRLIIPVSSSLVGLIDFAISTAFLGVLLLFHHRTPHMLTVVILPLLVFITFFCSVGLGSFCAALNVKYRDVRYVIPFFIQMFLFVTPVIYPTSILPKNYSWLIGLNPMSGVIEAARYYILRTPTLDLNLLLFSLLSSIAIFIIGIIYFRRTEKYFADII